PLTLTAGYKPTVHIAGVELISPDNIFPANQALTTKHPPSFAVPAAGMHCTYAVLMASVRAASDASSHGSTQPNPAGVTNPGTSASIWKFCSRSRIGMQPQQ